MKLIHAKEIDSTIKHETREMRRGDLINPITFQLPPEHEGKPLDEIIRVDHYDGTETLEITDAATDMNDLEVLSYHGREYRITETVRSRQYGFWDSIKCQRYLTNGI